MKMKELYVKLLIKYKLLNIKFIKYKNLIYIKINNESRK